MDISMNNGELFNGIGDARGEYYEHIKVGFAAEPNRMIRFFFPLKMMALWRYRNLQMGKKHRVEDFGYVGKKTREEWNEMVSCGLDKAKDLGFLEEWTAIERSLVVITAYAHDDQHQDVDNFTIVAINNALRANRIIEETNFNQMRYYVQRVYVPYSKDRFAEGTGVAVMDIQDDNIKLHNWNPKELAEW